VLVDIPYYPHHGQRLDVPDPDVREVRGAHLSEVMRKAQFLNGIQDRIQLQAELVRCLGGGRLELYEPTDQDVHIEEACFLVGLETQPGTAHI
jgi:hypothetical protein